MEPRIETKADMVKEVNQVRQEICKNATLEVKFNMDTKKHYKFHSGCKNLRRDGAAYCLECSNKHKA